MVYDLVPSRTALLIIDAQREYFDPDGALFTANAEAIRDNLVRLMATARDTGAQVVFVRHVHAPDGTDAERMGDFDDTPSFVAGTKGVELIAELAPDPGEPVIDKTR